MGKIVTPKYYVAAFYRKPNGAIAKMDLDWKGRPSEAKLEEMPQFKRQPRGRPSLIVLS